MSVGDDHDYFSEYCSGIKQLRTAHGLDVPCKRGSRRPESYLLMMSRCPDRSVRAHIPLSPCMRVCGRERLLNASHSRSECAAVLNFVHDLVSRNYLPGMCGGGVAWTELTLSHVNTDNFSEFVRLMRKRMYDDVQVPAFCSEQQDALRRVFGTKADDRSGTRTCESHLFCGMPEDGGLPSISLSVNRTGPYRSVVVAVDSYWRPAQLAFESTLRHLVGVLRSENSDRIAENTSLLNAMLASLAQHYSPSAACSSAYSAPNDEQHSVSRADAAEGFGASYDASFDTSSMKPFRCAGIEYMNAMSAFHRACLLSKVLQALRTVQLSEDPSSNVVDDAVSDIFGPNVQALAVPALSREGANVAGEHGLYSGSPVVAHALDPRPMRHALHSSARVFSDALYIATRRYALNDVRSGDAFFHFGDVGQGVFFATATSPRAANLLSSASEPATKLHNEPGTVMHVSEYCPSLHHFAHIDDSAIVDLVVPQWKSATMNITVGDVRFHPELSRMRSFIAPVVPVQLYYADIEPLVPVYTVANPGVIVPALINFFANVCSPSVHLSQVSTPEPIVTLVATVPLEQMSVREIVEKAERANKPQVILSTEHVSDLYRKRVPVELRDRTTRNRVVYGGASEYRREYYRVSLEDASKIASYF